MKSNTGKSNIDTALAEMSGEVKNGYLSALKTIASSLINSKNNNQNQGQALNPKMHMPNILSKPKNDNKNNQQTQSNQEYQNKDNNDSKQDDTENSKQVQDDIEKLREVSDALRDAAEDIIDDAGNKIDKEALDKLSDEAKVAKTKEDAEKVKARLERIASFWDDDSIEALKQNVEFKKQIRKMQKDAFDQLINKYLKQTHERDYSYKTVSIDQIARKIQLTVQNEVKNIRDSSWSRYNARSDDLGYVAPGRYNREVKKIPTILFYFDVSGSWNGDEKKINMGHRIEESLKVLANQKKIKLIRKYFGTKVHDQFTTKDEGNSAEPGPDIIKMKEMGLCDNLIIMTDDNPHPITPVEIDGCVWLLFYDTVSDAIVENIKSKNKNKTFTYIIQHD